MITFSLPAWPGKAVDEAVALDDLLDLALDAVGAGRDHIGRQESCPDQLLGDRRRTALARAARVLQRGSGDRVGIEALVGPEGAVLGGRRDVEHEARQLLERDDAALLLLEPAELDLAATRRRRSSARRRRASRAPWDRAARRRSGCSVTTAAVPAAPNPSIGIVTAVPRIRSSATAR